MPGGEVDGVRDEYPLFARDAYPLLRHDRPDALFARRLGQPMSVRRFLSDVAALSAALPCHGHVVNLCADRYRFAVGLAAALSRRQVTLLPPNDTPGTLKELAEDFVDLYCLSDNGPTPLPLPCMAYPEELGEMPASAAPLVPAAQRAVLLFTSGSTGRPKPQAKSWGTLVRSALAAGNDLGVGALHGATVIGTVPHQHSYGLESTVLLALQHGLAIHAERPFYPSDIRAALAAASRPRLLVSTPIHLRALLAEAVDPPAADLVISATAPLSRALAVEAEARFGAPLREIYGCSEAGQLALRETARETAWRCLEGVALRQDERGTWATGAPVETATLLQDVIELSGPRRFLLHGRTSDLVNIAGKRTSLAHLNHQLTAIEGVRDGLFVMPEESGERVTRLVAFVVAPGMTVAAILRALRRRVDAAFLPRPLMLVDALPRNFMGKLSREALLQLALRNGSASRPK